MINQNFLTGAWPSQCQVPVSLTQSYHPLPEVAESFLGSEVMVQPQTYMGCATLVVLQEPLNPHLYLHTIGDKPAETNTIKRNFDNDGKIVIS